MEAIEQITKLPQMPPRQADSNKGDYGKILVVAGSWGMSGAAILCASAALRGGAGLVRLAVPERLVPIVAVGNPCYTCVSLPEANGEITPPAVAILTEALSQNDVLVMGPGIGRSRGTTALLEQLLPKLTIPAVLDADALNILAGQPGLLKRHGSPLILTPHPGEFARLTTRSIAEVQQSRQELAVAFAREHEVVLVLKGHETIVTDGRRLYCNRTGNPGMATGGTGDVLAGLLGALLGQGLEPFAAAQLGVYLHGLAGDLARNVVGEVSLLATDLLEYLPQAFGLHAQGA